VLPKLVVRKPYAGKPIPLEFAANPEILGMILAGGEELSWE
jgi:hypothetical protein